MEMITEQAPSYAECYRKIIEKYGGRFKELGQKTVRVGGIFGLFSREAVEVYGYLPQEQGYRYNVAPAPASASAKPQPQASNFEEEKKKVIAAAGKDPGYQQVLVELRSINEKIDAGASSRAQTVPSDHATVSRLEDILFLNDFTPRYRKALLDRVKKEFSLEELADFDAVQNRVIGWIGESVQIYREDIFQRRPRIVALIGPTGVGKTTTIAKLAAGYLMGAIGSRPLQVRLITIDKYRIGAEKQIQRYGELMQIPVSSVDSYRELKEAIALNSEGVDLILIDTMGRSPRASVELGEMKQFLAACGSSAEYHLTLAATTKSSDIDEILAQFEPFGYRSVIVTKMDETGRLGNVISALADRGKSVSYITVGQGVPKDIQKADVIRFLINLDGFDINRAELESRFPGDETELIQWR
jgi:flagellar biosynthesis protein FlhF